jgi:uncharacterized protein (TIGR02996 family)
MSATLRHDIPLPLAEFVGDHGDVLIVLGAYEANRWAGIRRGHNRVTTFAIKLPRQIEPGYKLMRVCKTLSDEGAIGIHGPAWTLYRKLCVSFGLPYNEFLGQPCSDEKSFLAAIERVPGEIATWSAYSDWLTEFGDPRGSVIAAWLDPKRAVKTKYGVPVSVRHKLG